MGKRGPQPLPSATKAARGTLKPARDRRQRGVATPRMAPDPTPVAPRDYVAVCDRYVADVLAGRVTAGSWTKKACQRFERMRQQAQMERAGSFCWSPAQVQDVCTWIERLPHVEGKWDTPTLRLEPWQIFMLAATYGFRKADGSRLVNTVFFQVGRKSAKSTLVAACASYHLAVEREPGAQVICGASTGDQSRIVFSILQRMVKRSAWLRELGFVAYANAVVFQDTSFAKPINAKSSTQDGLNPSFISLDESHAQDFELHDVLKSAQGARSDALLMAPTTAGYSMTSVGYALRTTAQKILDGLVESDHTFVVLYELDDADDWRDEAVWPKALPMLGITPSLDYVRRYRDDAMATPGLEGEFQTKCCNRWLSAASSWLSMSAWDACADPTMKLEDFLGDPCWIGADLAQRDDFAALALVFQRDDVLYAFVHLYLPALVVQDRSRAVPAYAQWAKDPGILTLTDGNLIDFDVVETDIREACRAFAVKDICFDQFGSVQISGRLAADGLPARVEAKNAKTFTPPSRELEMRVKARKFRHDGNSALRWMASNCVVSRRIDDSILPKKDGPESANKIDGIDALLTAIGGLLHEPVAPERRYQMLVLGGGRP